MEEKERYKWSQDAIEECHYEDYDYIVDTENNIIFDDDNYFKLVNILNQQDKRIKKLETCLDEEIESNVNLYNLRLKTEQENQQLTQQLAITEKALGLVCERVKYFEEMQDKEMGFYDLFGYENKYDMVAIIKQYKQQAKEMLENE